MTLMVASKFCITTTSKKAPQNAQNKFKVKNKTRKVAKIKKTKTFRSFKTLSNDIIVVIPFFNQDDL